jgi:hypothetical protein
MTLGSRRLTRHAKVAHSRGSRTARGPGSRSPSAAMGCGKTVAPSRRTTAFTVTTVRSRVSIGERGRTSLRASDRFGCRHASRQRLSVRYRGRRGMPCDQAEVSSTRPSDRQPASAVTGSDERRCDRLTDSQYHLPFAKPPKAMRPTRVMMSPTRRSAPFGAGQSAPGVDRRHSERAGRALAKRHGRSPGARRECSFRVNGALRPRLPRSHGGSTAEACSSAPTRLSQVPRGRSFQDVARKAGRFAALDEAA